MFTIVYIKCEKIDEATPNDQSKDYDELTPWAA